MNASLKTPDASLPNPAAPLVLQMTPAARRGIRLASLLVLLAGVTPPALVLWQAFGGHLSKFSLIVLLAGFPYLVLCMFVSHLIGRFGKFNQLEFDEAGLRWRTTFFRVETPWENLAPLPAAGENPGLVGLRTRQAAPLQGISAFSLLPRELRGLPSGLFGDPHGGELAAGLRRYAPELYRADASTESAPGLNPTHSPLSEGES